MYLASTIAFPLFSSWLCFFLGLFFWVFIPYPLNDAGLEPFFFPF